MGAEFRCYLLRCSGIVIVLSGDAPVSLCVQSVIVCDTLGCGYHLAWLRNGWLSAKTVVAFTASCTVQGAQSAADWQQADPSCTKSSTTEIRSNSTTVMLVVISCLAMDG